VYVCVCVCVFLYQSTILIACIVCARAVISDLGHPADADVMFQASLVMLQEVTKESPGLMCVWVSRSCALFGI
jgi:hypothetical protein